MMNTNNSTSYAKELEARKQTKLTARFIWKQVFDWGIENKRIPMFKTVDEEIEHFKKPVKDFSRRERIQYDDAMDRLERHFELFPCVKNTI